jgi:ubiquinone/menaquinone biosynthesis C-methylase UbiE
MASDRAVARAVRRYARRHRSYERVHTEIFNDVEQQRLRSALQDAATGIRSGGRRALDFGCGSGNVTMHLLALDLDVTAADVSPHFLQAVSRRYGVPTVRLHGGSLREINDDSFNLIAVYSVLHHLPDYLDALRQMVAKLRRGGVLFLDHERNSEYWNPTPALEEFRARVASVAATTWWAPDQKRWQRKVRAAVHPPSYVFRARVLLDPKYQREGDIHVWPDDHIDWSDIVRVLTDAGCSIVTRQDYLLFPVTWCPKDLYAHYAPICSDTTTLVARRDR